MTLYDAHCNAGHVTLIKLTLQATGPLIPPSSIVQAPVLCVPKPGNYSVQQSFSTSSQLGDFSSHSAPWTSLQHVAADAMMNTKRPGSRLHNDIHYSMTCRTELRSYGQT